MVPAAASLCLLLGFRLSPTPNVRLPAVAMSTNPNSTDTVAQDVRDSSLFACALGFANSFVLYIRASFHKKWDADRYQSQHSFVYEYGLSLLDILDPKPGERILDLGCGTGELSHQISLSKATVIGIDADPQMIHRAQSQFSSCQFMVGDARSFLLDQKVDAVFSNAALHWVPEAERAVGAISRSLKPGGRFVAEFGGKHNVAKIATYLDQAVGSSRNPWYFPSIAEYSSILEKHGLEVTFAQLYCRPTPLNEGENGLRNWILMFGNSFLEGLDEEMIETVLAGAESELRAELHNGEQWFADYRRIRVVASKVHETGHPPL